MWITENGTCDAKDAFRSQYLESHLAICAKLCLEGIPVERYYHWTFMDNFEWAEGESARFGLVENDFETQRRTIRPSGRLFAEIARNLASPHAGPTVL
jgi:beta-glucosidase